MEDSYDIIVVGAGWFGLAAARAYLETHRTEKMAVIEAVESCGGTWSQNRLYPGLRSNNMLGTYEYPDLPMKEEVYGIKQEHIPAAVLHRYLTDFAQKFGIFEKIHFNTKVDVVEPSKSGGWSLTVTGSQGQRTVEAKKLILATGLTSTPNMPSYAKSDSFGAPFFHAREFAKQAPHLKEAKNVVVVGGAKSAYDVASAMVDAGATVDMVIRPNGRGPVWIAPILVTPFKKRLDHLLHLRWMTWFSPCTWGAEDGFPGVRRFLHGTRLGRLLVDSFWKVLGGDVVSLNGYDSDPELKKLKPWHSAFWIGSGLSVLNYDTPIFDKVKQGKIRVHVANIDHLEPNKVVFESGEKLDADALVCATGWKKESSLKFRGIGKEEIGLPFSDQEKAKLNDEADAQVLQMFPRLKDQPDLGYEPKNADPLRLYRFMIPFTMMQQRNLAFAGMVSTVSTSICASIQALWISLFFDGKIDRIPETEEGIVKDIMLHSQGAKWRFGSCGYGNSLPDFVFEKKSMFAEMTTPYNPGDYAGLIDEWKDTHGIEKK